MLCNSKRGKKDISVKIQLHAPTDSQKIHFVCTSPEVTGYDSISLRHKQTSDKLKKPLRVNEIDFNGEHFILEIKV